MFIIVKLWCTRSLSVSSAVTDHNSLRLLTLYYTGLWKQARTFSIIIVYFCKIPSPYFFYPFTYKCIATNFVYFSRKQSISTTRSMTSPTKNKTHRNLTYRTKIMISAEVSYMYEWRNHVYKTDAYMNV